MFGLSLLDVAIGTMFVFLLLSLVCSAINEIIEAWLKRRASYLERGIREMLDDPAGGGLTQAVYNHPLVSALFQGQYDPAKISGGEYERNSNLPAYIPSRNFALALMDVILPAQAAGGAGGVTPSGATGATPAADPNLKVNTDAPPATAAPGAANNPLTPLREAVGATTGGQARTALLSLIDAAGDDVAKARENIENWFNSTMDRVAGMYKRRAQWMILFLGLGVAIALNADTIYIVRALSNDSTLRASLVAAAQEYAKQPPNADSKPEERLKENYNAIQSLGLPIGWSKAPGGDPARRSPGLPWRDIGLGDWLVAWARLFYWHWLGWLLTAAAVSQGAPFWFDLLNKIIVVRSTVKPREKSPEESSKD